jgi:membrane fusion protein (multidrug efflux system)
LRTLLIYSLALATALVSAAFLFPELVSSPQANDSSETETQAAPPPVVVATVVRAMISDKIEALGTVRANESVELTPNRADHIVAVHFTGGESVEAGQLLLELNCDEEQARLAEFAASRDELQLRFNRIQDLFEQRLSSKEELENIKAELAAANARVARMNAAIADSRIKAPFAGTLGLRNVSVGAYVGTSTIVTTLDDLSTVKLDFTIPEAWLPAVRPGLPIAAVTDVWPGRSFNGTVVSIDTRLDPTTRSATIRAEVPNRDGKLRPGMLLRVEVDKGEDPVLQVPEEAIIPIGQDHFVLRVGDDSIASRVKITIGRRRVGVVEVRSGLAVGDRVITQGSVRVRPGDPVRIVKLLESR